MRRLLSICLLATVALSSRPLAAPENRSAPSSGHLAVRSAKLSIEGTSTMHDYSLTTTKMVVSSTVAEGASLLEPRALQSFELAIPVDGFSSDKDGLRKKFLETMKAEKHPVITFRLADYIVDGQNVRPRGTLTVAGTARDIELELTLRENPEGLHVQGSRVLSMKEFGIKPPTMFMGMLKTNDQVAIKFEFQLVRAAQASN